MVALVKYKHATGLPVKSGRPTSDKKPEKEDLLILYVQESRSMREIAETLGCKKDVIHYWLKKYGIPARKMAKRSKLLRYGIAELTDGVRNKGIRGYARELGVDESTLRHHLQVRKR